MKKEEKIHRRMLGVKELAEYLGLAPQTIRNKLANGTLPIPAKKIGKLLKFDKKDVDAYVDRLPTIN